MVICGKKVLQRGQIRVTAVLFLFIIEAWSSCVLDNWLTGAEPNKSWDISVFFNGSKIIII